MDAFEWAGIVAERLERKFGNRLTFVGLQGSRARGEAKEGSDIDLVVLFDSVDAEDLKRYRAIIQEMPQGELACGFVGSRNAIASWPRHELFQFYHDTKVIQGSLPAIKPFTIDDAVEAARVGASGIYHAACHAYVFDSDEVDGVLESLFKGAFFVLQALQFARTGEYPSTKAKLATQLEGEEAFILEIAHNWEKYRPNDHIQRREVVNLLLHWAEKTIEFCPETNELGSY